MTSVMARRRLGSTDIEITPIGLGTMQLAGAGLTTLAYRPIPQETTNAVIRAAVDGGVNWFDSAEGYGRGRSERALTTGLRRAGVEPGAVVIATKWLPLLRRAVSIERTIDDRLRALQDYPVDLHQIHLPWGSFSSHAAQLRQMANLLRAGKIRSVGVSNFSAAQLERAATVLRGHGVELASNQVRISALHRNIESDGVLAAARRLGVTLIAFSPLESGLLTGRFHDDPALLDRTPRGRKVALGRDPIDRSAPLIDELRKVAKAHSVTPAQVALAWLVTYYGDTVVAIPGASKPHQAAAAAAAAGIRLSTAELAGIDEASRRADG